MSDYNLQNHFLLAMPSLQDSIFAGSVTYICDHSRHGAMGLIINQPLDITLDDIFDDIGINNDQHLAGQPVMAGGPVDVNRGFVLHRHNGQDWQASMAVNPALHLTTSTDILRAIANNEGPDDSLIALGYAGWGPGQLEQEIADNAWLTLPADDHILFDIPFDQRAHAAASQLGVDLSLIAPHGHA